ncbi:MAG: tetratricopeptide repeat-containing protein [Bacteroidales bacterium]|nr:tetratricopeptide repeat-containing protein [Bacteroidales bacterium]
MTKIDEKICFVIMGFGKKKDPDTNRTIDLDETYKKIILPAVHSCGYKCIRADEILDSGLIDRSMYALLYRAELVIADISTYNPNAIYELGVRHVLKPFSTLIIKEDEGKIPFDINHNRTLNYKHLGGEISNTEAKKKVRELKDLISAIMKNPITDSPIYSYIPKIKYPVLSEEDLNEIIGELKSNENTIYSLTEKAKDFMRDKKFNEAAEIWRKLSEKTNNDIYYIQQEALCTYKSESPNTIQALTNALLIIGKISEQSDTETLGITGAINKNLWKYTKEIGYLNTAIEYYQKGWNLHKDYYTGENYAHCLECKSILETDNELKIHAKIEARMTRQEIIESVIRSLEETELEELMWKYATLSNCYLALDNNDMAKEFEEKFISQNPDSWQMGTFKTSKQDIINSKK